MRDKPRAVKKDFSKICVDQCRGACCAPWWGIINYSLVTKYAPGGERAFKSELVKGIRLREKRIVSAYITGEARPRPLFTRPERYNLVLRDIRQEKGVLRLNLILMFAFRCSFLSKENTCQIHPTIMEGADIRPPHCAALGSPGQRPGEQGYCPIIGVAEKTDSTSSAEIDEAICLEKSTAERYLSEGVADMEEAAERVVLKAAGYCRDHHITGSPATGSGEKKPGRNEPCYCGSGKKYKKCHGS
ncbi:MAG: SEC-C metal-binding domain-containing protein [Thermodesulfobacteriota bacterium]